MTVRRALVLLSCLGVLAPLPALAFPGPGPVLTDVAGDANGVNDQGEGLVGDQSGLGHSAPEADLRSVHLAPLRSKGRTTGMSLTVATTEPLRTHRGTGQEVALTVVAHVTSDCLFAVILTTRGDDVGPATLSSGGCGDGVDRELPVIRRGSTVRVDLPYRLLPGEAAPGARLRDMRLSTRLAAEEGYAVGEIDGAHGGRGARLPR